MAVSGMKIQAASHGSVFVARNETLPEFTTASHGRVFVARNKELSSPQHLRHLQVSALNRTDHVSGIA